MTHQYRCTTQLCRKRRTLPKKLELYVRVIKCKTCGGRLKPSCDKIRTKARTCNCDGYHFPHHKGTEPWCVSSKREPTEQEYQDRSGHH